MKLKITTRILIIVIFTLAILQIFSLIYDINLRLPTSNSNVFTGRISTSAKIVDININQIYCHIAEPYIIQLEYTEIGGKKYNIQLAFEELKWDKKCKVNVDKISGIISILYDDKLFSVINIHERWRIDNSGQLFNYGDKP